MIALKKKPQATKCNDHRTISLIAHTAKIATKILRRSIERKIEDVLGEDQFHCITVHFSSMNIMSQHMHIYIIKH
jgi:hypothetical protein